MRRKHSFNSVIRASPAAAAVAVPVLSARRILPAPAPPTQPAAAPAPVASASDTATARKRPRQAAPKALPPSLTALGNEAVWRALIAHMLSSSDAALLCGPVGSGKTCGVLQIIELMGRDAYELNPASTGSTDEMTRWIREVGGTKTLLGDRVIVFDDIEGLDARMLSALKSVCVERAGSPIVLICTDPWALPLAAFRTLTRFTLRRPSVDRCIAWLKQTKQTRGVDECFLEIHARAAAGDLRQTKMRLALFCAVDRARLQSSREHGSASAPNDRAVDMFTSLRRLLSGADTPAQYERAADASLQHRLLVENTPTLCDESTAPDPMAALAEMSEAFSLSLPEQYVLPYIGRAARLRMPMHSHSNPPLRLPRQRTTGTSRSLTATERSL